MLRFRLEQTTLISLIDFSRGWLGRLLRWLMANFTFYFSPLLFYVGAALAAAHADMRTLYTVDVPRWLDGTGCISIAGRLREASLTRTTILRIFHVVPDHTVYSRLEACHRPFRQRSNCASALCSKLASSAVAHRTPQTNAPHRPPPFALMI